MSRKVLVTGGGFIGKALAARLQSAGADVRVMDVQPAPADPNGIDWRVGDIGRLDHVQAALDGCRHVVHLAALLSPACQEQPLHGARVNLLGTLHVFEAARQAGIAHVVYASSAGVYGPGSAAQPDPVTLYGTWKLAGEGIARAYLADYGITSVGLRPFVVYGAGRKSGVSSGPSLACRAAVRGERYEIPFTGRTGLVHVDDVLRAFEAALAPRQTGAFVFNLPGVVASMAEVISEIRRHVPHAQLSAGGAPLPIAADLPVHDLSPVLGPQPVTGLAEGIAATIAACRG